MRNVQDYQKHQVSKLKGTLKEAATDNNMLKNMDEDKATFIKTLETSVPKAIDALKLRTKRFSDIHNHQNI